MATTDKLAVYNGALREIGGHPLANITTVNASLNELNGAFNHAVEHLLARMDWSFARRRATLTPVADTSYPPYTYRYTRPSDYLRKCWIKAAAADDQQLDHAEAAATIYGFTATPPVIEYISDHADNYNPLNWPPHFTRALTLYLASLVASKLSRAGADQIGRIQNDLGQALEDADKFEVAFVTNAEIPANRLPVFRRAIEFMGQALAGSVAVHTQADKLRWQMHQNWTHAVRYVLEQGAWNFATKRALLTLGATASDIMPGQEYGGIIEGYSVEGDAGDAETPFDGAAFAGYTYGWFLPLDFRHKIWIKKQARDEFEVPFQFIRDAVFANYEPLVLEYVAEDDWTTNPDNWSAGFLEVVAAYLAHTVAPQFIVEDAGKGQKRVTAPQVQDKMQQIYLAKLADAQNKDAIQQYPKSLPTGRFARARMGGSSMMRNN
jgi:hypothetical protein